YLLLLICSFLFFLMLPRPPTSTLFPYTTLFRSLRYQQSGIFQRIFHYGTLMILGSSTDLKYVFRYVPRVNKFHHILAEVHQKRLREQSSFPSAMLREKGIPPAS